MPFVPTPNGIEVRMQYRSGTSLAENVYHVQAPTAQPSSANVQDAINLFLAWENTVARNHRSQEVTLQRIVATNIASATGSQITLVLTPPVAGAVPSALLPNNATLAVTLYTNLRGRSFRGRIYWIGLSEGTVAQDIVTNAVPIREDVEQLRLNAIAANLPLCVLSKFTGGGNGNPSVPRAAGLLTEVTRIGGDNVVDSQRRRLQGRGQ